MSIVIKRSASGSVDTAPKSTTPTKARRKHVSENLHQQVSEEREDVMMQEINEYLRAHRDQIPDYWHLVKKDKLKQKKDSSKKEKKFDLPTSTNKLSLISTDRLQLVVHHLVPDIDKKFVLGLKRKDLVSLVAWGLHFKEDSAVPSKTWTELLEMLEKIHIHYGGRLKLVRNSGLKRLKKQESYLYLKVL